MTKAQYSKYLELPQHHKKTLITLAKNNNMPAGDIYWLEFGYAVNDPKVQDAMFNSIYKEKIS